tara:strand:- start:270 stop:623 length:354 start_codon:yes stop_codon:yes gene_type:complete
MPIKLKCPKCGESYKVADDRAGRSFRCRKCQGAVKVPVDMFAATLDKMEMEMASEMESEGSALSVDELMALSEAGEKVEESEPDQGTAAAAGPPWLAIVIGVVVVGGIAAGLVVWLK